MFIYLIGFCTGVRAHLPGHVQGRQSIICLYRKRDHYMNEYASPTSTISCLSGVRAHLPGHVQGRQAGRPLQRQVGLQRQLL